MLKIQTFLIWLCNY